MIQIILFCKYNNASAMSLVENQVVSLMLPGYNFSVFQNIPAIVSSAETEFELL